MASRVIEFRRPYRSTEPADLIEAVAIRRSSDILPASQALADFAADHGLRTMVWHDLSSQQAMTDGVGNALNECVFGWEPSQHGIWQNYDAAIRSPLVRASRIEGEPFWVNALGFNTRSESPFLADIDPSTIGEGSSIKAAIVVPVHLPFGQIAVAIFSCADRRRSDLSREFSELSMTMEGLSRRFLSSYVAATRKNAYLPTPAALTVRESECLRWAAFGKTDAEISTILGRSHGTIRYHLTRICQKLEADNRAQAIFKASQLGYICSVN